MTEIQDAVPQLRPCPSCGRLDLVSRAPVAYEDARLPVCPAPPVGRSGNRVIWTAVAGAIAVVDASTRQSAALDLGVAVFVGAVTVVVVNVLGLVGMGRRRGRIRRGLPAASDVWVQGWYCRRCDGVYFQPGYEPPGTAALRLMSVVEFQDVVFEAGGYGDLA
jgi:hypothetical protein